MELGKTYLSFEDLKVDIQKGDLDPTMKVGIVLQGNMGSLIALRGAIEKYAEKCGGCLIYFTITAQPLYIVHFNDLSLTKQQTIEKRRER